MKTKLTIRNCESLFAYQCPKLWSELAPTKSSDVRHCSACEKDVFFCTTDEETIAHAKAGHCIAREMPGDGELPKMYMGQPQNVVEPTREQIETLNWSRRESAIDDSIKNADADRSCPKCHYPAPRWRKECRVCGFEMGRERSD